MTGAAFPHAEIYSPEVVQDLGFSPSLILRSDAGGMGGASLLYQAGAAITSGVVDIVLCLGADTPMNITTPGAVRTWRYETDFQKPFGMMGPNSQFAFILKRHMHQYGTAAEESWKNRRNPEKSCDEKSQRLPEDPTDDGTVFGFPDDRRPHQNV